MQALNLNLKSDMKPRHVELSIGIKFTDLTCMDTLEFYLNTE